VCFFRSDVPRDGKAIGAGSPAVDSAEEAHLVRELREALFSDLPGESLFLCGALHESSF
jgi:hypothetical protein